ncbi:hypothetical protein H5410_063995 [Solanum commersonii]|uniref:Uncharacterized protein n=1 Tax=Solanum commersonii TaxID=4109 RepID=A0A9J5W0R9_SOLCO|nr:hypothetical protein H5410_063995 [Solanum commersonii]
MSPPPDGRTGPKAKRGRRSQGAFVRFFRADKEPAKAPCPLRLPNPRIPAAARGPRPRRRSEGRRGTQERLWVRPHAECEAKGDRLREQCRALGMQHRIPASGDKPGFSACLFRCDRRGLRVRASLPEAGIQPNRASPIPLMRRA